MRIFISYSVADAVVRDYIEFLLIGKFPFWIDHAEIGGGEYPAEKIEKALQNSAVLLLLWSANAEGSKWVRRELGYFDTLMDEDEGRTVIPIRLDATRLPLECSKSRYFVAPGGRLPPRDLADLEHTLREHALIGPVRG